MQITRTHTELGEEMLFDRGVYKEVFDGTVEYRVYDHNRCLISQARILVAYATPATDEAFASWLDILDPEGASVPPFSWTPPAPGVRVA
jgi:hypothetical protein